MRIKFRNFQVMRSEDLDCMYWGWEGLTKLCQSLYNYIKDYLFTCVFISFTCYSFIRLFILLFIHPSIDPSIPFLIHSNSNNYAPYFVRNTNMCKVYSLISRNFIGREKKCH